MGDLGRVNIKFFRGYFTGNFRGIELRWVMYLGMSLNIVINNSRH